MRALILTCMTAAFAAGINAAAQDRRAFEIAVGPVSGDLYVQGERLAGVISHPPGLSRCAEIARCGPEGLIATARASASASEGLLAIARGEIASAFSPADVATAMRLSSGRGKQNQSRLRAVGIVGEETLLVIASAKVPVKSLRSLRGRWLGIGAEGSRTRVAASALLAAAHLPMNAVRLSNKGGAEALDLIKQRKLDAFIWIGAKQPAGLPSLLKSGVARVVPLDKPVLERLTATSLGYQAKAVPEGETVSVPLVWLVDEKQPEDVVFSVVRAAFDLSNKPLLDPAKGDPSSLKISKPAADFPLPLHPGAAKFFAANMMPSN